VTSSWSFIRQPPGTSETFLLILDYIYSYYYYIMEKLHNVILRF